MELRAALVVLLVAWWALPAHADSRVALVIGNGGYTKVGALDNPPRDAEAMEALFRAAGFTVVEGKRDLGVASLRRALRDFSDRARDADIAVVFYAGHGIEVNGNNYLIPVDARLERDLDVEDEAVSLERVMQVLEPARRLRLVILDACRDNPFLPAMRRTVAGRSIGRGLAKVDVLTSDTLIAFAARHGSTAADGAGANSPYTTALIRHLTTPGLDLRLALGRVRDEVLRSTGSRQEPFVYGSLGGAEISLGDPAGRPAVAASPSAPSAEAGKGPAGTAAASAEPAKPAARPEGSSASAFTERYVKQLKGLADKHRLVLPELQFEMPGPDVPANLRRFIGIWFDETGGPGANKGKKNMLIVTRVDQDGKAEGHLAHGPPTATSFSREPAGHFRITGTIRGDTLTAASPDATIRYRNRLLADNRMLYQYENVKGQTASRYLDPVWRLVDVERAVKR